MRLPYAASCSPPLVAGKLLPILSAFSSLEFLKVESITKPVTHRHLDAALQPMTSLIELHLSFQVCGLFCVVYDSCPERQKALLLRLASCLGMSLAVFQPEAFGSLQHLVPSLIKIYSIADTTSAPLLDRRPSRHSLPAGETVCNDTPAAADHPL